MNATPMTVERAQVARQLDEFLERSGHAAHHPFRVLIGCPQAEASAVPGAPSAPSCQGLAMPAAAGMLQAPRTLVMDVDTLEDLVFTISRANSICEILEHLPTTEHATSKALWAARLQLDDAEGVLASAVDRFAAQRKGGAA